MEEKELDNIPQEISEEEEIKAPKGEGIKDVKEGIQGGIDDVEMAPIVKESFLDYAMSVIVSRALPDARDGFKPVQRRIIYGMSEAGMTPDKPFKKSARIVGDVMGKYHPHGDSSIYLAMARLAQDFAVRYPLVEGHGNYGSQDGDEPAASRYTEARMAKIALEMVKELGKETVKFIPTYDSDGEEPEVLPSRIPNLLINGSSGIAVGMATNIPPHNLKETISGAQALLKNPELTPFDLMQYIHGPDFPGGGTILGRTGIKNYFEKGQGSIRVRGKYNLVENNGKTTIVFTEVPYMVNKKELAKKIIELVDSKTLEGISAINDYSSHKMGTRFEIELKKGANVEIVLNHLFKYTKLQDSFAVNMLALDNGAPKILNMKQALNIFNKFQCELVEKRTRYNLAKAQDRLHILEGLLTAIDNIDDIVKIIKESSSTEVATNSLIAKYGFSDKQVKAILDMNLRRLVGLERDKILKEDAELKADIAKYNLILSDVSVLHQVVYDELEEIKNKYGDDRRTSISDEIYSDEDEDLIADEEILIMQTTSGYIKRLPPSTFKTQNRGGVGVIGMTTKDDDDIVDILAHSRTKTDVLFFTNFGKVYRLRGYQIPEGGRTSKGMPIVNLLRLEENEKVLSIISMNEYDENHFLFFITKNGIVKKTSSNQFENINSNGKIAISLKEGDTLFGVTLTDGNTIVSLGSSLGKVCSFYEKDVRPMGRTASGVIGMNLDGGVIVGYCTSLQGTKILTLSENGYGKLSDVTQYRLTSRGSKGVLALKVSEKAGSLVSLKCVHGDENVIIMTKEGTVLKTRISEIHEANRATMGVKVIRLKEGESISEVLIEPSEEDLEAKDDPSLDKEAKDEALENLLNKETLEEEENE